MKSNKIALALISLALASVAVPAMAHHATSTFYQEDAVELTGKIVELVWANPHGMIVFQDADGAYYVGEMASILGLSQQGLGSSDLPIGMEITVQALPSRDGSNRVHINTIESEGVAIYGSPDA